MELRKLLVATCKAFDSLGINYVLIGGYAGILYGSPYTTADIDFVVVSENVSLDLLKELGGLGWKPTETYSSVEELRAFGQFYHETEGYPLHIFPEVDGYRMGCDKRISEIEFDGYSIKVCSPEDLIVMRLSSWREEDKIKAAAIAISAKLDRPYLRKRAAEEQVESRLDWLMKEIREAQD